MTLKNTDFSTTLVRELANTVSHLNEIVSHFLHYQVCANPSCNTIFYRVRRQIYCTSQCSNYIRQARFREAHHK